ncbi:MAG: hypothetical protein AB7P00_42695 [Sandaracinaceae bacterium]
MWVVVCSVGLASCAFGPGCGGASPYDVEGPEPERENPAELESEQIDDAEQLDSVLAAPEVQCDRACDLGNAICDLGERICGIAERHPSDAALAERCRNASGRCDGARERIAAQCTCDGD